MSTEEPNDPPIDPPIDPPSPLATVAGEGQSPALGSELESILLLRENPEALKTRIQTLLAQRDQLRAQLQDLEAQLAASVQSSFLIDTEPIEDDEVDPGGAVSEIVYESKMEWIKSGQDSASLGPRNTCFNCGGSHMIADCQERRDPRQIAKNRKEFLKNQPAGSGTSRYHLDEPQKFGHLTPGWPSAKLREALGLRADQLPGYIYRMRVLGYPPGWMKEAEIRHSGIALFVNQGHALSDLGAEDGEVVEAHEKVRYDLDRLVTWPGFNAPLTETVRDESHYYDAPPMSEKHSLAAMRAELSSKTQGGYIRGEMQDTTCRKRKQTTDAQPAPPGEADPIDEEPCPAKKSKVEVEETENENQTEADGVGQEMEPSQPMVTQPITDEASLISKGVEEGTPIVHTYSDYKSLPDQNKWAKDVTDHILFENLPDTTGKWDQMRKVIQRGRKVRSELKPDKS
ncbi:hypothetical protein TCAL_00521 [Tigriopus californicus]|uniref:PSP proline-rich domain-containing protein n=1 Tax=Tigriopus californicus TaxID=6832 RepID=A0A553PD25_TIGCA|nr:zinc finger CCHC domain-containing protein 8 homolog [Tigriopus californicus]TRY75591.1 hypothetical protein TCAL_00521 [Tigriopus californicus]|eukprot:TCALIF_00521-PA protein Name:"Similar to CG4622 Zinc finger CCHC domain-containing protein 8 homolog (Drosophila melanogaster)" AED:0.08 eAED:0.08 QI:0/-1/0/1/-1/1/1/0/456